MKKLLIAVCFFISASTFAQIKKLTPFKNGDRIVFAGNSIAEHGYYETYIWQYYMLHFPERRIQVKNCGIGGDVAGQILARLDRDILIDNPTVVVLSFGMNDSRYFEYLKAPVAQVRSEAVATSKNSYKGIEQKLKALPNVQKIIMTSSPFDETMTGPKNNFPGKYATMLEIANFQEAAAKSNHWGFVDLIHPMTEIDQREQKKDSNFTLTGPDRIHPGNGGHLAMAYFFLKAQGLTGSVVADVTINAANGKLIKSINSTISNIIVSSKKISFNYKANSLPFPVDTFARIWGNPQKESAALAVIPFTDEFNKELLRIKELKSSNNYALIIDGTTIGEWNGAQFANGINLAVMQNTPQYIQAQKIADLNIQYHELEQKMRAYYWLQFNYFSKRNMMFDDSQAAMDSVNNATPKDWAVASKRDNYKQARIKEVREGWKKEMKDLIDRIYILNKPAKHSFVIELVNR